FDRTGMNVKPVTGKPCGRTEDLIQIADAKCRTIQACEALRIPCNEIDGCAAILGTEDQSSSAGRVEVEASLVVEADGCGTDYPWPRQRIHADASLLKVQQLLSVGGAALDVVELGHHF